ncbi:polysaccharide deacetylase family protein [candidate division KSB1 bacterium]|nr:polysaccharide deacetylase family protein [candidate division KSB1 bacterium]
MPEQQNNLNDVTQFWAPYKGAVSLTFDDGTANQLEYAVPLLDEFNLKATFFITPSGNDWKKRLEPWRNVAMAGHEIGNHSLSHICSDNIYGHAGGLEEKTLAEIEADILTAQERIMTLAHHQKEWTFAYPCYNTDVGRGSSRQSYIPTIAKHFIAGRTGGEYGFGNHPLVCDLAALWGLPVERMSGYEMIGLVEQITGQGRWVILIFHGIGGSYLSTDINDFRLLLEYLKKHENSIRIAPMGEIAQFIKNSNKI